MKIWNLRTLLQGSRVAPHPHRRQHSCSSENKTSEHRGTHVILVLRCWGSGIVSLRPLPQTKQVDNINRIPTIQQFYLEMSGSEDWEQVLHADVHNHTICYSKNTSASTVWPCRSHLRTATTYTIRTSCGGTQASEKRKNTVTPLIWSTENNQA